MDAALDAQVLGRRPLRRAVVDSAHALANRGSVTTLDEYVQCVLREQAQRLEEDIEALLRAGLDLGELVVLWEDGVGTVMTQAEMRRPWPEEPA